VVPPTIRLSEWSTTSGVRLTTSQRDALRATFAATIQPTSGTDDRYDVTPSNIVGTMLVEGTQFLVQPKIPIDRVMFLIGYLTDSKHWHDDTPTMGDQSTVIDAVAALFARLTRKALQRGMLSGYHDVSDDLTTVRGRIDLSEQLKRRPGRSSPLALRYTEYDHDVLENQLLGSALTVLLRLPLRDVTTARSLRRLEGSLEGVTPMRVHPSQVPTVHWTRLNAHYAAAVELARLLLSHQSPELIDGPTTTSALTVDMAYLFETFVRTAIAEATGLTSAEFPDGDHVPPVRLDEGQRIKLKPDLSLWRDGECTFIGDVKYKRDSGSGTNPDLYQLLAYASATNLADATLIYAFGPPEVRSHTVRYVQTRLHIRHLDLAKPGPDLLAEVAAIAREQLPPATHSAPASA
jgi:5-methylcytosine-specific restriction enzyme subunit McrC